MVPLRREGDMEASPVVPLVNIGDLCTHCLRDTAPGTDLFADRIPSGSEWSVTTGLADDITVDVNGWMCVDCYSLRCSVCDEPTADYTLRDNRAFCSDHA